MRAMRFQARVTMSDSKFGSDGKGGEDAAVSGVVVDVTKIVVEPNVCELSAPLNLDVEFTVDAAVVGGQWEVKYLVDSIARRHIIVLGRTEPSTYGPGANSFSFKVPYIDVTSVKRSRLADAGLLIATLLDEKGTEIMDLNMVVQVTDEGGVLTRTIFNPLE